MSVKEISWNQTVFSVMRTTTHLTYATFNVSHMTTHLATIHVILRVVIESALRAIYTDPSTFCVEENEGKGYLLSCYYSLVPIMQMRGQAPLRELVQQFRLF